jgi:glycosyltransferase involved in cell wall biosynthesis
MRILVHDYSGHPFQVQLSRALARRGHDVLHVHCSSYPTGKGAVDAATDDPDRFRVEAIGMGRNFDRYSWLRRMRQEWAYGGDFAAVAARFGPQVVLSSNDPLFAKARAARWCRRTETPWVFWLQDIYSHAMSAYAKSKLGVAGVPIGAAFHTIERKLLRDANAVVPITADFSPTLATWGIDSAKCVVIENWAPVAELPVVAQDNAWARAHDLAGRRVVLYTGTLGLKHDPSVLVALARQQASDDRVRVVVVSEGLGADWLREQKRDLRLDNLVLLPYQPYDRLPEVMGTATILVALLEAGAGVFSVPSKVLSYLCAGRPVLGAMPSENLAAEILRRADAGEVVAPGDADAFTAAAARMLGDPAQCVAYGEHARAYAESEFDIDRITDRFEPVLQAAAGETVGAMTVKGEVT